jgi:epoxyqueuosine reductase
MMTGLSEITFFVKQTAKESGFDDCGIAKATHLHPDEAYLKKWISDGFHAGMKYMESHTEKRVDPGKLFDGARSVVVVLLNYYPSETQQKDTFIVSKYAYGTDYHDVLKEKLQQVFSKIQRSIPEIKGRIFTDSAPVLERAWAREAGLGWIGKSGLLITKKLGSYVFIGELILNIDLDYDMPVNEYCGTCTRCMDACPTKAIISPGIVDSNKCISYHTIESKEQMPSSIKSHLKNRIFGCDTCQDVCMWNNKAKANTIKDFSPKDYIYWDKEQWNKLTNNNFKILFAKTPFYRTGYKKLKDNIIQAYILS